MTCGLFLLGAVVGYLFGSLPFSWWVVRATRSIDMRHYGSRTVSAALVGVLVSKPAAALVGLLDIAKGFVPVAIGYRLMPDNPLLAGTIGLAALLGHCWPVWLGFHGGRGISVTIGTLLVLFPWGVLWILLAIGLGQLARAGAIFVLVSLGTLPVLAALSRRPAGVVIICALFFLVVIAKRLEANREPLPPKGKGVVLLRRLLLDRDIKEWSAWFGRRPQ